MSQNAIIIDKKDNVATALRQLDAGESVHLEIEENAFNVILQQAIPFGHKFSLKDIERGEQVVKYGEVIGLATKKVMKGEHVHVNNVDGLRGRGDKR